MATLFLFGDKDMVALPVFVSANMATLIIWRHNYCCPLLIWWHDWCDRCSIHCCILQFTLSNNNNNSTQSVTDNLVSRSPAAKKKWDMGTRLEQRWSWKQNMVKGRICIQSKLKRVSLSILAHFPSSRISTIN